MKKYVVITLMATMMTIMGGCGKSNAGYENSLSSADVMAESSSISVDVVQETNSILEEYNKAMEEIQTLRSLDLKEAYEKSQDLCEKYPDSADVKELASGIKEEYVEKNIIECKEILAEGDILSAVDFYNFNINLLGDDSEITTLINEAIKEYENNAIAESDTIFFETGVHEAIVNIIKYQNSRFETSQINERLELYKSYEPVSMLELKPFVFDGNSDRVYEWGEMEQDNLGNTGYVGYKYYVADTGWADKNYTKYREWKYTYLLDGMYDSFDAVLAVAYDSKDYTEDNYDAYIEIYNGDYLIYTSEKVKGGIIPKELHADIKNAQEITIVVKGRAFNCGSMVRFEVGLLNPTFSKSKPEAF